MRPETGLENVSLPSGGGGLAALGERFQPDLTRGSGSYSVPLPCPKGPNDLAPSISLTYSTGSGNGPFGLGWRLQPLRIERRTDRGIPNYLGDEFTLGGAEVLVEQSDGSYRPRTDTQHWRIRRLAGTDPDRGWQIEDGLGAQRLLGATDTSKETGPQGQVFAWCLSQEVDPAGNAINYEYFQDGQQLYCQAIRWSIWSVEFHYESRPDVLRNARAGFQRTTQLRARAIDLNCTRSPSGPLRTWEFSYQLGANGASQLQRIELSAGQGADRISHPALTFGYAAFDPSQARVEMVNSRLAPPPLTDPGTTLVDLDGDGLPDVLQLGASFALRWRNSGDGSFAGPFRLPDLPSTIGLSGANIALADLNSDGRADLFSLDPTITNWVFQADGRGGFDPQPRFSSSQPSVALADPNTRLTDLDGDGATDLLWAGPTSFVVFTHDPQGDWRQPTVIPRIADLDEFPDLSFTDDGVHLADMTGDGLQDIVLIRSGEACYWPALGGGHFGPRVTLRGAPTFPPGFREDQIYLVDLDGDGCADVVFFDAQSTSLWLNQCGNSFAPAHRLPFAPPPGQRARAADLFGDGRPGFVWDSSSPGYNDSGYRVLRFAAETAAPYLMTSVANGLGGISQMRYESSTTMRLRDETAGRPWQQALPLVVQVLAELTQVDTIAKRRSGTQFQYHDGVWDGTQREFRGFREVTVIGGEVENPLRQVVGFFQGDPDLADPIERERERALAGSPISTETSEFIAGNWVSRSTSTQVWEARREGPCWFPHVVQIETRERAPGEPDRVERTTYPGVDSFGNITLSRRISFAATSLEEIITEEHTEWIPGPGSRQDPWLVHLPTQVTAVDGQGVAFSSRITHYDGPEFVGLPQGQASAGLSTASWEARLLDDRTPADFLSDIAPESLGFRRIEGIAAGWYARAQAAKRDARGNIVESLDPVGGKTSTGYDPDGVFPQTTTDPAGRASSLTFDLRSAEPATTTLIGGRKTRSEYDLLGRLIASYEDDDLGTEQLVKAWVLDLATPCSITSYAPSQAGSQRPDLLLADQMELPETAGVSVARSFHDGFGNSLVTATTVPGEPGQPSRVALSNRVQLNARGLVVAELAPRFAANLDWPGLPTAADLAEVSTRKTTYDAAGLVTGVTDPGGATFTVERGLFQISHRENGGPITRTESFDARGRLIAVTEFIGDDTSAGHQYELDADGRVAVLRTDDSQEIARWTHAGPADPIRITHRDSGSRQYLRDAAGRLIRLTGADGSELHYRFDVLGRVLGVDHKPVAGELTSVREISYETDPSSAGRVATVREGPVAESVTLSYGYDHAGRPNRETHTVDGVELTIRRKFNLQGRMTQLTYPDNSTVDYQLHPGGAVLAIAGFAEGIEYAADGGALSYQLPQGGRVETPRDSSGRFLGVRARPASGPIARELALTYGADAAISQITDTGPAGVEVHEFSYDQLHRLTQAKVRSGTAAGAIVRNSEYSYDPFGNLLSFGDAGGAELTYAQAAHPGRVTSISRSGQTAAVNYGPRGEITDTDRLSNVQLDAFDRMTGVDGLGTELRFRYDPQNRRVLKEVFDAEGISLGRIRYLAGLWEESAEHSQRHVFLGTALIATVESGVAQQTRFHLADQLGTIIASLNGAGEVLAWQRYAPFGAALIGPAGLNKFLGRDLDQELGLVQLGGRWYHPALGRFISADWYVLENPGKVIRLPQGFAVYSYALNNPLSFKDPSGLWFGLDDLLVAAVGFVVGFVSGLIYGLANGQGWGSFLTALETGLTTAAGAWLGWTIAGPVGMVMGGMNGLVSGIHGIYDWSSPSGWFAFLSDSTWNLIGTSLGNVVHIINLFYKDANYRDDLSRRQNRAVYEGGFALKKDFAFTQGNVISNAGQGGKGINASFIAQHEELHVWQQRFFGPLFQVTYIVWGVGGAIVGSIVWLWHTDSGLSGWGSLVETAAYYDNPFEYWAYKNDNNWPPSGANPILTY